LRRWTNQLPDWGPGLSLLREEKLREFAEKQRQIYPGSSFPIQSIVPVEDYVVAGASGSGRLIGVLTFDSWLW
jgi:hypothetical protein